MSQLSEKQKKWLGLFCQANPLIHLNLSTTVKACEEHLTGVSNILTRLSGKSRSKEVDIALANAVDTAAYALSSATEQQNLDEEKESSEQSENENTDE